MAIRLSAVAIPAFMAVIGLSACNPDASGSKATSTVVATSSEAEVVAKKRRIYVENYNDLIDPNIGVGYVGSAYEELNIEGPTPRHRSSSPYS